VAGVKLPARHGRAPAGGEAVKFLSVMPNLYVADPDGNWIAVVSKERA
jgi:hypothetical protein